MGDLPSVDKGRPEEAPLYALGVDIGTRGIRLWIHLNAPVMEELAERKAIPHYVYAHGAAGAALILMGYLLAYLIQFEAILGEWTGTAIFTVVVMVMVMVLLTVRREEKTLAFGRAFGLSVFAGFLARLGYTAFHLLIFHVMRPDLTEPYVDLLVNESVKVFALIGMSIPEEAEAMMEQSSRFFISVPGQFFDVVFGMLWISIVALVVAAILKRNPDSLKGMKG